jgi:hypothetical protein
MLKPASAYPFTSCSASRSSFQGTLHASRTRFILGAFTTTTGQVHLLQQNYFLSTSLAFSSSRVAEGNARFICG